MVDHAAEGLTNIPFGGHPGPVWAVAVSPDGNEIVTGGADGTARVWSMASGQPGAGHRHRRGRPRAPAAGAAQRRAQRRGPARHHWGGRDAGRPGHCVEHRGPAGDRVAGDWARASRASCARWGERSACWRAVGQQPQPRRVRGQRRPRHRQYVRKLTGSTNLPARAMPTELP